MRNGPATEYTSRRKDVPECLIVGLAILSVFLCLLITVGVPWSMAERSVQAIRQDASPLEAIWFAVLSVLSFLVLARWSAVQISAIAERQRRSRGPVRPSGITPFVSILVPAYQEAETIVSALESLLDLDYPSYEIIVVDDGSTDATFAMASVFVGNHGNCTLSVHRKSNGGKWSALNLAFRHSKGELILCIDADSRLSGDALKRLVARMTEPGVVGVAGQVTVRNRGSLITRLQALEYVLANGGLRSAQSLFGMVLVVPGPIGLYRRTALKQIADITDWSDGASRPGSVPGPFSHETFAEDFQLSLTALALGGRIVYEPRAIAYTKAPDRTHSLLNQRYRWLRGPMQVLKIYWRQLYPRATISQRRLSWALVSVYLLDLFILPVLSACMAVVLLMSIASDHGFNDLIMWSSSLWLLSIVSGTYHIIVQEDDLSLLSLMPVYDVYQGLLLNGAWGIAVLDEIRDARMHW